MLEIARRRPQWNLLKHELLYSKVWQKATIGVDRATVVRIDLRMCPIQHEGYLQRVPRPEVTRTYQEQITRQRTAMMSRLSSNRGQSMMSLWDYRTLIKRNSKHRLVSRRMCGSLLTPPSKDFVEDKSLEFFSIGGDPAELMAFMVKNPGPLPSMDPLKSGDVGKRWKGMYEIIQSCWKSCIQNGDGIGASSLNDPSACLFVADAIIA